jgi:hypothetical protein
MPTPQPNEVTCTCLAVRKRQSRLRVGLQGISFYVQVRCGPCFQESLTGHVTLPHGERSRLAAENLLKVRDSTNSRLPNAAGKYFHLSSLPQNMGGRRRNSRFTHAVKRRRLRLVAT